MLLSVTAVVESLLFMIFHYYSKYLQQRDSLQPSLSLLQGMYLDEVATMSDYRIQVGSCRATVKSLNNTLLTADVCSNLAHAKGHRVSVSSPPQGATLTMIGLIGQDNIQKPRSPAHLV